MVLLFLMSMALPACVAHLVLLLHPAQLSQCLLLRFLLALEVEDDAALLILCT
jgi:hypothetical protein